jgi:pimeloyl-ACP methyl ester carboxylesterase/quercetin dioxygenase-like cupin family protein
MSFHRPRLQPCPRTRAPGVFAGTGILLWVVSGAISVRANDDLHHHHEQQVTIDTPLAVVGATIAAPGEEKSVPCVVIAGGTLSQDRNGRMFRAGIPQRNALERLADALAVGGYASVRYDKVGFGESKPKPGWSGTYTQEAQVLSAVVNYVRERGRYGKLIVAGESAGGYLACLAAKDGTHADAYLFLGAHCGPGEEIYAYNFGRLVEYVGKYPETLAWAAELKSELALGRNYKEMFVAAARGDASFELVDGDFRQQVGLARRREELEMPPDRMFAHIRAPALALSGAFDLNVAPEHAAKAVRIMREAGNEQATSVSIAQADHSFQQTPASYAERMRERFTLQNFVRPYQPAFYREVILWLQQQVPSPVHAHLDELAAIAGNTAAPAALPVRAEAATEIDKQTASTPRRVQLAPGVEIIDDITAADQTAGVETLEGRIGPLLLAEGCQAHFIDMPAGMFVGEHPHSSESIIYTVRGRWVLCSKGRRHVMKPGTLFRFGANVPTGYEVPFDEPAYILIFKGDRTLKNEQEFIDYLRGMAERVKKEQSEGVPYLLKDLPEDHPARKFAAVRGEDGK